MPARSYTLSNRVMLHLVLEVKGRSFLQAKIKASVSFLFSSMCFHSFPILFFKMANMKKKGKYVIVVSPECMSHIKDGKIKEHRTIDRKIESSLILPPFYSPLHRGPLGTVWCLVFCVCVCAHIQFRYIINL